MSNKFQLLPAIDILGGTCVRLMRGDYGAVTEYEGSPVAQARKFIDEGCGWLHVVDLDGAKDGRPVNTEPIRAIVALAAARGVRVQVGGGIRSLEALGAWRSIGASRCVVGTVARNVEWMAGAVERFGSDAVVAGLDGRDGQLAVEGWNEQTDVSLIELARSLFVVGVRHAIVTDVDKDGTLAGANLGLASAVQETGVGAIASGGIRDLSDVLAARDAGLAGAIAGRSLYDGTMRVAEALAALALHDGSKEGCRC